MVLLPLWVYFLICFDLFAQVLSVVSDILPLFIIYIFVYDAKTGVSKIQQETLYKFISALFAQDKEKLWKWLTWKKQMQV